MRAGLRGGVARAGGGARAAARRLRRRDLVRAGARSRPRARDWHARRPPVPARGRFDPDPPRHRPARRCRAGRPRFALCTDALVGLAKEEGIAVLMTGHVTKDGDLAGPRTLEHAVDVVLTFDGDPRSGLRVLSGGKNRFGAEGETAWFEMGARGWRRSIRPNCSYRLPRAPGAAIALPQAGRRALAVEVQALVGASRGAGRRQATGLDPRRFQLVAAVLDRAAGCRSGRCELFGASSGGVRLDDPACDLAIAAALASAATGVAPPAGSAFVGEVALTGPGTVGAVHGAACWRPPAARGARSSTRSRAAAAGVDGDSGRARAARARGTRMGPRSGNGRAHESPQRPRLVRTLATGPKASDLRVLGCARQPGRAIL